MNDNNAPRPRLPAGQADAAQGAAAAAQQVAPPPAYQARPALNPLYVRAPPQFKSGSDLELYLQRFRAYARSANCPQGDIADLLISLLDDKALSSLTRILAEGGYNLNDVIT